jgi:hypothetical protein
MNTGLLSELADSQAKRKKKKTNYLKADYWAGTQDKGFCEVLQEVVENNMGSFRLGLSLLEESWEPGQSFNKSEEGLNFTCSPGRRPLLYIILLLFLVVGIQSSTSCMLGKHSTRSYITSPIPFFL